MNIELIGFAAAALTSFSFLPQVILAIRTRDTRGISLSMYATITLGIALWLVYGILLNSWPIILANTLTLGLAATILALKLRYG